MFDFYRLLCCWQGGDVGSEGSLVPGARHGRQGEGQGEAVAAAVIRPSVVSRQPGSVSVGAKAGEVDTDTRVTALAHVSYDEQ